MGIQQAVIRGRVRAEALMHDACTIEHPTGETTVGGVITTTYATVYAGKCRVQIIFEQGRPEDIGQAFRVIERREVQVPVSVTGVVEGDRVTVTASALDPDLVGAVYTVRDVLAKTHLISRRLTVQEATS